MRALRGIFAASVAWTGVAAEAGHCAQAGFARTQYDEVGADLAVEQPVAALDLRKRRFVRLNFGTSDHGFAAGFADLPSDYAPEIYELEAGWRPRPASLGGANGLYIQGHNRSDDLFMFWKRQVTGLQPNTTYRVHLRVEFISSYRTGSIGIGGSPADSVFVKLGATQNEPLVTNDKGMLLLNVDKGFQSQSGTDAAMVGTVALPARGKKSYGYVRRNNHLARQMATTDGSGSLWLFFGTDSGFEGLTEIWYTRLSFGFIPLGKASQRLITLK